MSAGQPPILRPRFERNIEQVMGLARKNGGLFTRLTLRSEETDKPLKLGRPHKHWHRLIRDNRRVGILGPPEFGKTQQIIVGRTLFELGRSSVKNGGVPRLRVAIGSNTLEQATKSVGVIRDHVESNEALRRIFPAVQPGAKWTDSALWCKSPIRLRSPNVQAFGWFGNLLGSRIDLLFLDDVDDFESTSTPAQRKKHWEWFQRIVIGRLTKHAKVVAMGQVFHKEDFIHRLEKLLGWPVHRFPAYETDPQTGKRIYLWPERWGEPEVEARRRDLSTPAEFDRQMLCLARSDDDKRFPDEAIKTALLRGQGRPLYREISDLPPGAVTLTGVDLGFGKGKKSGRCVIFTIMVYANGDRRLLWVDSDREQRWRGPEIMKRILDTQRRFKSIVYVENNGAQQLLQDFAADEDGYDGLPIYPFHTGARKNHPVYGVEGIAGEMIRGRWIIPNEGGRVHPEVQGLLDDMDSYTPGEHTGDYLMAMWFAREGARYAFGTEPEIGVRVLGNGGDSAPEGQPWFARAPAPLPTWDEDMPDPEIPEDEFEGQGDPFANGEDDGD